VGNIRPQYWLVKHDKFSIEDRPGWIWRTTNSKNPPNYQRVKSGDKFILYAHQTSEDEDSEPCYEVYGFYKVLLPVKYNKRRGCWEIKGKRISKEGWVRIPNPSRFYQTNKFNQQSVIRLNGVEFRKFLKYHEKFLDATWGIFNREPENEQEVIALFTNFIGKLGYKGYEKLGTRTPDAIIIRKNGRRERVEFEYTSQGLKLHTLKELKGVKCICWIDDLPPASKYRKSRMILSLKEKLKPNRA
jgi:hypothetical protein